MHREVPSSVCVERCLPPTLAYPAAGAAAAGTVELRLEERPAGEGREQASEVVCPDVASEDVQDEKKKHLTRTHGHTDHGSHETLNTSTQFSLFKVESR